MTKAERQRGMNLKRNGKTVFGQSRRCALHGAGLMKHRPDRNKAVPTKVYWLDSFKRMNSLVLLPTGRLKMCWVPLPESVIGLHEPDSSVLLHSAP